MATVIQIEHARQGFEDLADLFGISPIITEARIEPTGYEDRHSRPLLAVVVEALAATYPDAERMAAKLVLGRAETALTSHAGLVCWTGWLRHASQYDPVTVRLYAPTAREETLAGPGVGS
ncbi:hypothetical protein [Promicromonospora soli]